ncbi:nucleotidyltransferase family protein [Desulfosarcina ovata]|uniref:nucleotidyltransferase family protein n=1 Tax=Desulfosarcina ovata TaxID=83564 RepID=UPI0012D30478|nr:nucleotidyltransferase domain-containing protein [Desulfosarcina ovata]
MSHLYQNSRNEPFDISVWQRTNEKKRQEREWQRLKVYDRTWDAIDRLKERYPFDAVYFFGSLTKPYKFFGSSDIDIGIEGLDKYLHYRFISDLTGLLKREIDVVRLEDCPFAETIRKWGVQWKRRK